MLWLLMHQTIGCDQMLYKPPLQPANIFLDCNLDAKLGDIGLAAMEGRHQGA